MIRITPDMFFDAKPVRRAVDRAKRSVLMRAGAFVRRRAQHLIRRRRRSARPGEPPSSHTGLLRRFIYFGYQAERDEVVVGPVPLPGRQAYGPTTVPEVLELGGTVTTFENGEQEIRHYEGNPFMQPALEAERDNFADLWAGSVKR